MDLSVIDSGLFVFYNLWQLNITWQWGLGILIAEEEICKAEIWKHLCFMALSCCLIFPDNYSILFTNQYVFKCTSTNHLLVVSDKKLQWEDKSLSTWLSPKGIYFFLMNCWGNHLQWVTNSIVDSGSETENWHCE